MSRGVVPVLTGTLAVAWAAGFTGLLTSWGPGVKDGASASSGQVLLSSAYGNHYRRMDQIRENGWWSSMRR